MEWDLLRQFLAVARHATLSSAARTLATSPATLHRRINELELKVGHPLFIKKPAGYRLTPDGEILFQQSLEVEEAVLRTHRSISERNTAYVGEVRITLPDDLVSFVTPAIEQLCRAHAGLKIAMLITSDMVDIGREADIALRFGRNASPSYIVRSLAKVNWCLYHHHGLDTVSDETPYVGYDGLSTSSAVQWLNEQKHLNQFIRVNRVSAALSALENCRAVGLLPCFVGDGAANLVRFGTPQQAWATELFLVVHEDLRRAARVRLVADALTEHIEGIGGAFLGQE